MNEKMEFPYAFIGGLLISQEEIEDRIQELGEQITEDYKDSENLLLLGLLRGSVMFITDLMKHIRAANDDGFYVCFFVCRQRVKRVCTD